MSDAPAQFDAATRTLKVRLELDNPDFVLKPDMFVDVELPVTLPPGISASQEFPRPPWSRGDSPVESGRGERSA